MSDNSKFKNKQDISLLTLLANESTSDARKLLIKNGKQDATDFTDLEKKLTDLYFNSDSKIELEKQFAEIHPHKKWLLKYVSPKIEAPKVVEKKTEETIVKHTDCPCLSCRIKAEKVSSAEGLTQSTKTDTKQDNTPLYVLGMVTVVAILGIAMINKR